MARVLKDLAVSPAGKDLGRYAKMPGVDNFSIVTEKLNRRINGAMGMKSKDRDKVSTEKLQIAFDQIDALADQVRDELRTLRGD